MFIICRIIISKVRVKVFWALLGKHRLHGAKKDLKTGQKLSMLITKLGTPMQEFRESLRFLHLYANYFPKEGIKTAIWQNMHQVSCIWLLKKMNKA